MSTNNAKLLTLNAAARLRGVYAPRLRRAIRDGELHGFRIGAWIRVRVEDVDRWIEAQALSRAPTEDSCHEWQVLQHVRALIERFLESDNGMRGRIRDRHRPLSDALDVIAAAISRAAR